MPVVAVQKTLRTKLSDEGVDELVTLLDVVKDDTKKDVLEFVEEKFERRLTEETTKLDKRITEETTKLDKRITEEASKLDKRITEEVAKLDKRITEEVAKLNVKLAEVHTDIIKWMFIFCVGQFFAITGVILAFLKFML